MCRLVRDFHHGHNTWLVVLAGSDHRATGEAWRAGADDCVSAPAPAADLRECVEKGLRAMRAAQARAGAAAPTSGDEDSMSDAADSTFDAGDLSPAFESRRSTPRSRRRRGGRWRSMPPAPRRWTPCACPEGAASSTGCAAPTPGDREPRCRSSLLTRPSAQRLDRPARRDPAAGGARGALRSGLRRPCPVSPRPAPQRLRPCLPSPPAVRPLPRRPSASFSRRSRRRPAPRRKLLRHLALAASRRAPSAVPCPSGSARSSRTGQVERWSASGRARPPGRRASPALHRTCPCDLTAGRRLRPCPAPAAWPGDGFRASR